MMNLYRFVSIVLFVLNISFGIYFTNKVYKANWLWKVCINILCYFTINTLSSMIGFYICRNSVNRIGFTIANIIILWLGFFILYQYKEEKIIVEGKVIYYAAVFFCFMFLLLFFSTGKEGMPIWGNVDAVVHFEITASLYNALNLESPLGYLGLVPLEERIAEFSYMWAYHYNCAIMAYILNIDIWNVIHFVQCLCTAGIVAGLILLLKNKSGMSIIACIILSVLGWKSWYVFLNDGYSPNLFAFFLCILSMGIMRNCARKGFGNIETKMIFPVLGLVSLVAYLPVGITFTLFLLAGYFVYGKKKDCIFLLIACLLLVLQPVVFNSIMSIFESGETAVVALNDTKWMKEKPSILWFILTILVSAIACIKKRFSDCWLIIILAVICVCFLISPTSYVLYKFTLLGSISLLPFACDSIVYISKFLQRKWLQGIMYTAGMVASVILLNQAGIFKVSFSFFPLVNARQQIAVEELECLDYALDIVGNKDVGVEYLGWEGPTSFIGEKILGQAPYSYLQEGHSWRFVSKHTLEKFVGSTLKRQAEGKGKRDLVLLINRDNVDNLDILNDFLFLFDSIEEKYYKNGSSVWETVLNQNIKLENISGEELQKLDGCIKKEIQGYDECIVLAEKDKPITLNIDLKEARTLQFLVFEGRVINESDFIIRGMKNGECVYEKKVNAFEKICLIPLEEKIICDEIEVEAVSEIYSDSVIIKNIYFG